MNRRIAALRELHPQLRTAGSLRRQRTTRPGAPPQEDGPLGSLLQGGLTPGDSVEIVGRRTSGRFSTLLQALSRCTRRGDPAGLVDLGDGLDPRLADAAGIDLERLLWTRPRQMKAALITAELLLNAGFPLVAFDLGMPPVPGGRGPEGAWMRLSRAAQQHGGILLISSPYRASGTATRAVIESNRGSVRWLGSGHAPRLLCSVDGDLSLLKANGSGPTPPRPVRWSHGAAIR